MATVKAEATRIKGGALANRKSGIKVISKLVSEHAATPLLFVKRGRDTEGGGKKGTIAISPQEIDVIAKWAWKRIYVGMASNLPATVANFHEYSRTLCCINANAKYQT